MTKDVSVLIIERELCPRSLTYHSFQVLHQHPYHLSSHPCSLQILHEDETSPISGHARPLAAFAPPVKMTTAQIRRARMMNKQMSEDCTRLTTGIHIQPGKTFRRSSDDTQSLQKLDSCEMKDFPDGGVNTAAAQPPPASDLLTAIYQNSKQVRKQFSFHSNDGAVPLWFQIHRNTYILKEHSDFTFKSR